MAVYFYETITPAEALNYNAATDVLVFSDPNPNYQPPGVIFNANGTVTLIESHSPQPSVTFGAGFQGEMEIFTPDHNRLLIGTTGNDAIGGTSGTDYIYGGPGADTLMGGGGTDILLGDAGADLFVIRAGDAGTGGIDIIAGWESQDRIAFAGPPPTAANVLQLTGPTTFDAAYTQAGALIAQGVYDYVFVRTSSEVWVFADSRGDNGGVDDAVIIQQSSPVFGLSNLTTLPGVLPPPASALPAAPTTPSPGSGVTPLTLPALPAAPTVFQAIGTIQGNMDTLHIGIFNGEASFASTSHVTIPGGAGTLGIDGSFALDADGDVVGGTVTQISVNLPAGHDTFVGSLAIVGTPLVTLAQWVLADATSTAFASLLAGNDSLVGPSNSSSDLIRGYAGDDIIEGKGGADSLFGGLGNDVIFARDRQLTFGFLEGFTYLRGDEGDDWIIGAGGFDDINGNMGNDTASGGDGADWVVGGKDHDLLFGDDGDDIVYGNLGNDSCVGGAGADLVRGGQADDRLWGGDGNDWLSGDRGNDTLAGGAGADTFHSFAEAGIDRVLDFTALGGDRVQLDPGTAYTVSQVGGDVVIDFGAGNQMILVGVTLSSLPPGWIFGA